MDLMTLQTLWFILVTVLLTGYAILDGFDLGVGILHLFTKGEEQRRINLNSVGPVWDGNEVWLIAGGGALFAAFAPVYAAIWSGFYLALMLLLVALIGRAVAIDFRAKVQSDKSKQFLDYAFGIGSFLIALLLGVAFGNILRGIPIDKEGWYAGTFFTLLNPYAIIVGLLTVVLFTMHGALFLSLKTDGERQKQLGRAAHVLWMGVALLYLIATIATYFAAGYLWDFQRPEIQRPIWMALLVLTLIAMALIPLFLGKKRLQAAFVTSAVIIAGMLALPAVCLFPRLVPSSIDPAFDLTAFTHSSTQYTLQIMLYIALAGMPFAILYKVILYRVFRGKTVLTKDSY
jgi:cytochrome d ubiquinol oxidase subunit II